MQGSGPTDIEIAKLHFANDVIDKLGHWLVCVRRAASAHLLRTVDVDESIAPKQSSKPQIFAIICKVAPKQIFPLYLAKSCDPVLT